MSIIIKDHGIIKMYCKGVTYIIYYRLIVLLNKD
jgi:hypothetical protein